MSLPSDPTWQTASWTSVQFVELGEEHGWERGQNERGPYAKKPYMVAWTDVNTFARNLRGLSSLSGGLGSGWVLSAPLLFPDDPSDNIYCTGITVKATGQITGSAPISYTYAVLLVTFTPLTWDANSNSDPFGFNSFGETAEEIAALQSATQEIDGGYMEVPIPKSAYSFVDGTKVMTPVTQRIPVISMTITWERLPYLPMAQIASLAGYVNASTFLGKPTATVLFEPVKSVRQVMPDGTVVQRVQMAFKFRPISWNQLPRPDTGVWATVTTTAGNPPFPLADFTPLLF